jgi:hypothetical protein
MAKFATIALQGIRAREKVEQLVVDDIAQLDQFEKQLVGTTYEGEYKVLLRYIEHLANGNRLPEKKFRLLKGVTDGIPEFELKSKHLRIYGMQLPSRKLVLYGGFKNTQDHDITQFRSLKKRYLEGIQKKK